MKKTVLLSGILISTMFLSACTIPYRLYQQKPPANLNNGNGSSQITPPSETVVPDDVGVPDTVESVEEVVKGTYIENINCGYLSVDPRPENGILYLVCDEEDIEMAETALGMKVPDNAEGQGSYVTSHIEAFQEMKSKYPIDEYNYLFSYSKYNCLGYDSHADEVIIRDGNQLLFHYDIDIAPGEGEAVCEAMDGEFKIAAIPKDIFITGSFYNVVRPSEMEIEDDSKDLSDAENPEEASAVNE